MNEATRLEGGCLCGAVRYRLVAEPYRVSYCHCSTCRKAQAAPVTAWLMCDDGVVEFINVGPRLYDSSPGVKRGFCGICGSPLWWQGEWDDKSICMVPIASLDDPERYVPDRHANCSNQLSWFEVDDDLPRHAEPSPDY